MRNMSKEINGAAGVTPDPAKRFVVKVQAPIGDPVSAEGLTALNSCLTSRVCPRQCTTPYQ
jgi:hypothetical protein